MIATGASNPKGPAIFRIDWLPGIPAHGRVNSADPVRAPGSLKRRDQIRREIASDSVDRPETGQNKTY